MTNILTLARSGYQGTFTVANNADWLDSIAFTVSSAPIDITGIAFEANMRSEAGGHEIFLALSTGAGTLTNGGASGVLSFNVPALTMGKLNPGNYVIDILAIADGHTINLYQAGPAKVVVDEGIT